MKRLVSLAAALLIAGCATTPRPSNPRPASWIIGTWLGIESEADRDLAACQSGLPIGYRADGTYVLFEETGTWRLDGNRLTEVVTEIEEGADSSEVEVKKPYVSRVRQIDADSFVKTFADGSTMLFLRCRVVR